MSLAIEEKYTSRQATRGRSVQLQFIIFGTDDEVEVLEGMDVHLLSNYEGATGQYSAYVRESLTVDPEHIVEGNLAACQWLATVEYAMPAYAEAVPDEPLEVGGSYYTFDISGGTTRIKWNKAGKTTRYPADATDSNGAIGVTADGNIEGVDVMVPTYIFGETHVFSADQVDDAYKDRLFKLTGKTNNAAFRGQAIGECLFLGAAGAMREGGDWEIAFRFASHPNELLETIGGIEVASKKGWEHAWVRYKLVTDTSKWITKPEAIGVYVEELYLSGSFSDLNI